MKLETYFCAVIYPEVVCTAESSGNLCFAAVALYIRHYQVAYATLGINLD